MTFPTEAEAYEFLARMMPERALQVAVVPTTHEHWVITDPKEVERPAKLCSICGEPFTEFANNAQPINGGRCCAYCDDHVVTPARVSASRER